MWLLLAFTSALLLGLYDVAKKQALRDNAVLPVLLLNTLFSSLLFLPTILSTAGGWGWFDATPLRCPAGDLHAHLLVVLKSCIVLSSWVFGYFGIKHLPLTIDRPNSKCTSRSPTRRWLWTMANNDAKLGIGSFSGMS